MRDPDGPQQDDAEAAEGRAHRADAHPPVHDVSNERWVNTH